MVTERSHFAIVAARWRSLAACTFVSCVAVVCLLLSQSSPTVLEGGKGKIALDPAISSLIRKDIAAEFAKDVQDTKSILQKTVQVAVKDAIKETVSKLKDAVEVEAPKDGTFHAQVDKIADRVDHQIGQALTSSAKAASGGGGGGGKGDWVDQAVKILQSGNLKSESSNSDNGSGKAKSRQSADWTKRDVTTLKKAESGKAQTPSISRHSPAYVRSEERRDLEAQKDMRLLKKGVVLVHHGDEVKAVKLFLHSDASWNDVEKSHTTKRRRRETKAEYEAERNAEAKRDMHLLEKGVILVHKGNKEQTVPLRRAAAIAAHTATGNRDKLAQEDLNRLTGRHPVKPAPITSRHNPAYVRSEERRDLEAQKDMRLLKKGVVLVQHGDEVKAVKFVPPPKPSAELQHLRHAAARAKQRAAARLTAEAQRDLSRLKKGPPRIGDPFHAYVLPTVHTPRVSADTQAQEDLKVLSESIRPTRLGPPPPPPAAMGVLAQQDLKALQAAGGRLGAPGRPGGPGSSGWPGPVPHPAAGAPAKGGK